MEIINPWSGSGSVKMSWPEIAAWGRAHVNESDLSLWLRTAGDAWRAGDGVTLGKMIIGS